MVEAKPDLSDGYFVAVEATAYTPFDEGCSGIAFDGNKAEPYKTLAVDPRYIPLGSKVYIDELKTWFLAHDTGGAIKHHIVDICVPTKTVAFEWGRRNITVYVVPPEE